MIVPCDRPLRLHVVPSGAVMREHAARREPGRRDAERRQQPSRARGSHGTPLARRGGAAGAAGGTAGVKSWHASAAYGTVDTIIVSVRV